jgi:hypothetical protein
LDQLLNSISTSNSGRTHARDYSNKAMAIDKGSAIASSLSAPAIAPCSGRLRAALWRGTRSRIVETRANLVPINGYTKATVSNDDGVDALAPCRDGWRGLGSEMARLAFRGLGHPRVL